MPDIESGAQVADSGEMTSILGVGSVLASGRYRLVELLGSGGFGQVFRAEELGDVIRRDVAIKVLHPHVARQSKALERFRTEVRLIGNLNHPNIIQVFWDGSFEGRLFFVMEYHSGSRSLGHVVHEAQSAREYLSLDAAKSYFLQVAQGLRAIHRLKGVFHRDIKLENLLLWEDPHQSPPRIKIVDFGVAHHPDVLLTHTGEGPGTPAFLAPETVSTDAEGKPYALDSRVDLFALGVALFQFVTLELPFQGMQASASPIPAPLLSSLRPVPAKLDAIGMRLLEKDRDKRYPNADALIADLEAFDPKAACVESPGASLARTGTDLPSFGDISRLHLSTHAGDTNAPIILAGLSLPASPQQGVLDTEGQRCAQVLHEPPQKKRVFTLQLAKRDQGILCSACLLVVLGAGFGWSHWRAKPATQAGITAADLRSKKADRTAISAQDILRDERSSENQFVQRPQPQPAPRVEQDRPKRRRQRVPASVQTAAVPAATATTTLTAVASAPPPPPPTGLARFQTILVDESKPEQRADPSDGKTFGIPTATMASASLTTAVSSDRPNTLALASLVNGISVGGRRVIPAGSQLVGKASYQERGTQWFVELRFDRLVLPDGAERHVQVIATQHGQAGLRGMATKRDSRDESNLGTAIIQGAQKALSDQPGTDLTRPFLQDRTDDLRELRRGSVVVQLPRGTTFQAQFLQAM